MKATLQLALEALESCYSTGEYDEYQHYDEDLVIPAITAIKAALEAHKTLAQQERISDLKQKTEEHSVDCLCADCSTLDEMEETLAQQCVCGDSNGAGTHRTDGPCLAPQRTWVGLTDEEVNELVEHTECEDYHGLVEATESKLKEKNA